MKINRLLSIAAVIAFFSLNPTTESCNPLTAAQPKSAKIFENVQIEHGDDGSGVGPSRSINSGKGFAKYPGAGGGGGTPDSSDRKVKASDLRENIVTNIENFRNLSIGNQHSDSWRCSDLIGHYLNINISNISKVNGVYSHFPAYFDYNLLKSGAVQSSIDETDEYKDTYTEALSFSSSVDSRFEGAIAAKVSDDSDSLGAGMQIKSGATYAYGCALTRSSMKSYKWSASFSITAATAAYCPDGYALSIGKQGTYYVIEGDYQEYSIWWWGDYPTSGSEKQSFKAVFSNPSDLVYSFVYKLKSDTERDFVSNK